MTTQKWYISEEEILDELDYIKSMTILAWESLGLSRDSIVIEEVYTNVVMKVLNEKRRIKSSFQVLKWKMLNIICRKWTKYFSEIWEQYDPEFSEKYGSNNIFIENIIDELKTKCYSQEQMEDALYYYNTLWSEERQSAWSWRNMERRKLSVRVRDKVKNTRIKLSKDTVFYNYLLRNLELANNYDFI